MMLCKFARSCVGFVSRLERSSRQKRYRNRRQQDSIVSCFDKTLEGDKRDHLTRTKGSYRQSKEMEATVIDIEKLSSSVRGMTLLIEAPSKAKFKAGQWVDMVIPTVQTVGGFSVCSPPHKLDDRDILQFAVKYSDHPPAKWVHEQCYIGAKVTIQFGGEFYYEPMIHGSENVFLIAGGVGINPIYSILLERWKLHQDNTASSFSNSTKLMYSARTTDELIFKKNIERICNEDQAFTSEFFVTQEKAPFDQQTTTSQTSFKRIKSDALQKALDSFSTSPICFICGPPNFIDYIAKNLNDLHLEPDRILFEKWW